MKKIISRIKLGALLCIAAIVATSCLSEDTNQTVTFSSYFTISGITPNYTLLDDGGITVYPTAESVNYITNGKGFGKNKRAILSCSYDVNNDRTVDASGKVTIKNAKLLGGQFIETTNVLNRHDATDLNILVNDSIFPVQSFSKFWVANGYLSTLLSGQFSAKEGKRIVPTINLYAAEEDIKQNEISFTILYNRHSSKNENAAGVQDCLNSYSLAGISVPGSDSIKVTINVEGAKSLTMKVGRKDFQ